MVIRNTWLFILSIALTALFWIQVTMLFGDKPEKIRVLEDQQAELNEQLISAQILASKLDRVYTLFDENLALTSRDSLAEDASIPFIDDLTEMLRRQNISLESIKPKERIERENYIISPYQLLIRCSFDQLGEFMSELERSPRLISVDEFSVNNGIERIKNISREEELQTQFVELSLSTLTLVKSSESGKGI
ncbi:MAG: type 4a pilus biogenesis protein PilO [FCB group bacterium]|nr:type 4a pilus biogenesis protein PilO [FCB group bacterium]